jgi:hypothetical protein
MQNVVVWANLRWRSQPGGPHDHKKHGQNARPDQETGIGDRLSTEDTENAEVCGAIGT